MSADEKAAVSRLAQASAATNASASNTNSTDDSSQSASKESSVGLVGATNANDNGSSSAKAKKPEREKNNVRKTRIEKMMSKAELARRANLSVLTIDRIEKGFGCRMDTKRKILEALGLSLADRVRVFGEEE
ncbi:MAG: helix-turn-helix transcriptional regulator [Sandaracinaceae bacterium]|nr:helix-turn-helix transcriptional regulator [Sandaracinaceae bacterium]